MNPLELQPYDNRFDGVYIREGEYDILFFRSLWDNASVHLLEEGIYYLPKNWIAV